MCRNDRIEMLGILDMLAACSYTDQVVHMMHSVDFWLIWFINQRALNNHALSIIGVSVGIICAHLPLAHG